MTNNYLNLSDTDESFQDLEEAKKSKSEDPPAIVVMRRKSIRQFPNGQKVALYYIDKFKKYVTVPYDSSGNMSLTIEEEEPTILESLQEILNVASSRRIVFDDSSSMVVDRFTAESILNTYEHLNESNKQKLLEMAQGSKYGFKEVVEFVSKRGK
jgi:hypothetical protein